MATFSLDVPLPVGAYYDAPTLLPSSTPSSWRDQFGKDVAAFLGAERSFSESREAPNTYERDASGVYRPVAPSSFRTPIGNVSRDTLLLGGLLVAALLFAR